MWWIEILNYLLLLLWKKEILLPKYQKNFFRQERDWTCSIACIRTLLSSFLDVVPSEDFFVIKYGLSPSVYYSKDIKKLDILSEYDVIYCCDEIIDLEKLLDYIDLEYFQIKDNTNLEEHKDDVRYKKRFYHLDEEYTHL